MDKTYAPANLQSAFDKVWRNGGSAGADAQTVAHFARHAEAELQRLHEQLREGTYRPQPVRRAWIPKPGSKEKRPLGIPAVRDRIVQGALRHVLEPIFEAEFAEHSYGFRPGRGAKDALRRVDTLLKAGHDWVVDADLKSYFDTIPHERLLASGSRARGRRTGAGAGGKFPPRRRVGRSQGLATHRTGHAPRRRHQSAAGEPVSQPARPSDGNRRAGRWCATRTTSSSSVAAKPRRTAALAAVRAWVSEAGLTLHPEKTRVVNAAQPGGFDFLGYHFERGMRWPRKKSLGKLKDRLRAKTARLDGRSLPEIVADVNRSLRGWYGYFQHSKAQHVCVGGRLRAATVAESAAMAIGWRGQGDGSRPSTLAERVVCPPWAAVLGSRTRVDADNRKTTNPLTGEPDAGDPPVRFGGRGKVQSLVPTPIPTSEFGFRPVRPGNARRSRFGNQPEG